MEWPWPDAEWTEPLPALRSDGAQHAGEGLKTETAFTHPQHHHRHH